MGRRCSLCARDDRDSIDLALVSGATCRKVAEQFGLSESATYRHRQAHISAALAALHAQDQAGEGSTLVDWVKRDQERTDALYLAAVDNGQSAQALNVLKERRGQHELLARLTGALSTTPTVTINLMASEEYVAVRSAILAALMAYPDARQAVAGRLLALEAGPSS